MCSSCECWLKTDSCVCWLDTVRERRVTMKQLVDELKTKKFGLEWRHLEPPLATISRDRCERLIIHLMVKNILQPEISYTAYNTICYLVVGSSHRRLANDQVRVVMKQPAAASDDRDDDDDTPLAQTGARSRAQATAATRPSTGAKKKKRQRAEPEVIDISE